MSIPNGALPAALPRVIPERVKEARESRGFSGEVFGDLIGVSRQAIAQYETGLAAPSGEVLTKMIQLLSLPPAFFSGVPATRRADPSPPFFRSLKRMDLHHRRRVYRRLQWAADISALVERFIDLPSVNLPQIDFCVDSADDDAIERAAELLREHWELGSGPIRNLDRIMEANGIVLVRENVECPDMDAVSCWVSGRPIVLLAREVRGGPRDLFNLAHELAHLVLHAGVDIDSKSLGRIEKQAHRFAGAFLLPREQFSRDVLSTSLSYMLMLKKQWGVSIAAMAMRAEALGLINRNQCGYVFRQLNARRMGKVEELDDAFEVSCPSVLRDSIRMLIEHRVYTRSQIEEALCLNMSDVESLIGAEAGFLDQKVVTFTPRVAR